MYELYDGESLANIIYAPVRFSLSKWTNEHKTLLFVLFVSHSERGMAEIEGSGGSTRTNEARCYGEGSYRAVECTRRSSASIAGITSIIIY